MNTMLKSLAIMALPFVVLVLSSASTTAQETKPKKKVEDASPAGVWTWERKSGDSMIQSKVTLVEKKGKFSGELKDTEFDLEIKDCKFENGTLSFEVFPHPEQPKLAIKFAGKVTADKITGTMNYTVNEETKAEPWTADRFDPLDAVVGKWRLEFETPDGVALEFKFEAKKKRKGLDVTFEDKTVKVSNVKFEDGLLKFDSDQVYEEQPVAVEWDLAVEGNQVNGTLYYSFEGDSGEGELEVKGERIK